MIAKYKISRQMKEDFKQTEMTDTLKLCVLFKQLGKLEVEVMCYLDSLPDIEFVGNYSDLTRAMNHPDADIPNITKAVKRLKNRGIVIVWKDSLNDKKICAITLSYDWDVILVKEGK